MDYYDASAKGQGDLASSCSKIKAKLLLLSFSSDWLYPPEDTREVGRAVLANNQPVSYLNIPSDYGHDAFLLETDQTTPLVESFLRKV